MNRVISRGRLPFLSLAALVTAVAVTSAACGGDSSTPATTTPTTNGSSATATQPGGLAVDMGKDDKADLTGAGASFPAPLYQAWFADYNADVARGVKVNYQSIGSGGGIQQFTEKTVDFGASDAPMSDEELAAAPDAQHLPTVLGAVVITYNLEGLAAPLKLDGDTIARIFLDEITAWDDPAIAALNPGVSLPSAAIEVVHRSDGSGTSFVFTDYLTKVNEHWASQVGTSKNPNWPAGQGGKGNEGVANLVKQTPEAIGYVELSYAIANKLPYADVKNADGQFVTPTLDSTSAAAGGVTLPDDYRVSITNGAGADTYPIATFTYLLVRKDMPSCSTAMPLVHLLWWAYHAPQAHQDAIDLLYAPLPESVLPRIEATLKSLTCEGRPIL